VGSNMFLIKPFTKKSMIDAVIKYTQGKQGSASSAH